MMKVALMLREIVRVRREETLVFTARESKSSGNNLFSNTTVICVQIWKYGHSINVIM